MPETTNLVCQYCGKATEIFELPDHKGACCDCILKLVQCATCPTYGPEDDFLFGEDGFYCRSCATIVNCPSCNKEVLNKSIITIDNINYCCECAPKHNYCFVCKSLTANSLTLKGKTFFVCKQHEADISICDCCNRMGVSVINVIVNNTVYKLCGYCYSDGDCPICNTREKIGRYSELLHPDFPVRVSDQKTCINCVTEHPLVEIGQYAHQSSLDHSLYLPKYYNKTLYYGIELEQECIGHVQRIASSGYIWKNYSDIILDVKHDGSLSCGHETVTKPITWDVFKTTNWDNFYKNKFIADAWNGRPVGMHVHMSLDAFTTTHLFKFCDILYACDEAVKVIGGRGANQYCEQPTARTWAKDKAKLHLHNTNKLKEKTIYKQGQLLSHKMYTRYDRVNLTRYTAELRFFNSPHTVTELMYRMEFCESLYQYTKETPLSKCCGAGYWYWFIENQKKYPNLYNFCYRKKLTVITSFTNHTKKSK